MNKSKFVIFMKKTSPFLAVLLVYAFIIMSCSFTVKSISASVDKKSVKRLVYYAISKYYERQMGIPERKEDPRIIAYQNLYDVNTSGIDISFNYNEKTVFGNVTISAQSLSDTLNIIYLNLYGNMKVKSVKLNDEDISFSREVNLPKLKDIKIDDDTYKNYIVINSKGKLKKSDYFTLYISYYGKPYSTGFDSFSFKEIDGQQVIYSLSEPTFAPTWYPCKDILTDKFISNMNITVPPGMTAASNGLLSEVKKDVSGNDVYCWKSSYPIASYLVSLVVTKLDHWSDEYYSLDSNVKMPVDYYSFPSYTDRAKKEWKKTPDMIKYFSEIVGEYPFIKEKYGMTMFGWTSGAMEHQTLTSMGYTFVTGSGNSEDIISHELAHQWFGDAITPGNWKDVWLNEGFATYLEAMWMAHSKNKTISSVMTEKDYGVFNGTVYAPDGFIFNSTVYQKGAWCLHMLRGSVGDSVFFKILREYYDSYKFKNAVTKDFKTICEKISGKDLTDFFDQWIYKGTGRPEYEYSYKADNFMGEKSDSVFTLRLNLVQKQTDWDVYKMPVRVTVLTDLGEQEFTVYNFKKKQQFEQPIKGKIKDVIIDKDNWILKEVKKVQYQDLYD